MTTAAYPLQSTLSTPAQADLSILLRDTTALRLLRLLQNWARTRIVEPARGSVWVVRHHLEGILGVVGRTVRRALRLLEQRGWILPAVVRDENGVERGGFIVAVNSAGGFLGCGEVATAVGNGNLTAECAGCDETADIPQQTTADYQLSATCPPDVLQMSGSNYYEEKENNLTDGLRGCAHDSGPETPTDRERSPQPGPSKSKTPRRKKRTRDAKLWRSARRVAAYERNRQAVHPKAKSDGAPAWPAFDDSCWAVYRLMERTGYTEAQLKAAIDLTWDRAVIHDVTWHYWCMTTMWEGSTPGRLQGWLREPHNAKYLAEHFVWKNVGDLRARQKIAEDRAAHKLATDWPWKPEELVVHLRVAVPPLSTWTVGQAWTEGDVVECMTAMLRERGVSVDEADVRKWAVDFLCRYAHDMASAGKA